MSQLVPCPSCSRHVRRSASACPFCQGSLQPTPELPVVDGPRLSRAQAMGMGVAVGAATVVWAMSLGGCPAYGSPREPVVDAGADTGGSVAAYGAPSP